ncbi:MAG: DoxX family membrane protein, partial [Candidatus Omnitrophica bacterium]|nr:DoxX family membrane protein [Candidatus Omnitrophota bacterium]
FFLKLPWDVNLSVLLIGSIETATGIALISGLFTRFFALAAAVQLAGILVLLKFQEFRDIGLLAAAIYLAMVRPESFGIDYLWKKRRDK